MNTQKHQHSLRQPQQFPFYRTYIDIECRKDILVQNEHVNKKVKAKMTPFMQKVTTKAKENKFRLIYFFGFIVLFKLEPVYDYLFCQNKGINWVYNNIINYYTDYTKPIQQSALQTSKEQKLVSKSRDNQRLADLFYRIDKNPRAVVGYNQQSDSFVNSEKYEISLDRFIEICNSKYGQNYNDVELKLRNTFMEYMI